MDGSTIYALSSGAPPAAIAVVRVSGPRAFDASKAMAGTVPPPRRASLATIRHPSTREILDRALLLAFPRGESATGEDLVELHLHGGRAVVDAVLSALAELDGLRAAEPGEFTRRAFENGRIDLAQAEGLADLLAAETETQRRAAMAMAEGALSRRIGDWQARLLGISARLEAMLDFADEGDVEEDEGWRGDLGGLAREISDTLAVPSGERLKDGVTVVIAGPPNAGKSTLFNALAGREAAITSPLPGTTRDRIEAPVAIGGVPFLLIDTAGLRDSADSIETIGVARARDSVAGADLVLWLGPDHDKPERSGTISVQAKADLGPEKASGDLSISALTGQGLDRLVQLLQEQGGRLLPGASDVAINRRHRAALQQSLADLLQAAEAFDVLIAAELVRSSIRSLDRITGAAGTEDMLDALFGRFCIGK